MQINARRMKNLEKRKTKKGKRIKRKKNSIKSVYKLHFVKLTIILKYIIQQIYFKYIFK